MEDVMSHVHMERMRMLKEIQELEFVAVELNLYLDTHPEEREPLMEYNKVVDRLMHLKKMYEQRYGPLYHFGLSPSAYPWQWIQSPWPWEM